MRRTVITVAIAVLAVLPLAAPAARADDTIRRPGDHPTYDLELEPHGTFGWGGVYGTDGGFGLGARLSIPIVRNGFVPTINNSVAISFGLDWVHYGCFDSLANCTADYLDFPVAMQWNFYVSRHWSVFGEPGLYIYHGFFSNCFLFNGRLACPSEPTQTGVLPAFYVGARYHFTDKISITMRVGYPTLSVGVSFFL